MSTDRAAIKERLRRLLAVTVENGASEAEAMVAAQKAASLMAEHSMSYRTVEEIEADAFADDTRPWFRGAKDGKRGRNSYKRAAPVPKVVWCLQPICTLCGVEHVFNTWSGTLTFFGPAHATEAAHYFVVIVDRAMEREWQAYAATLAPSARQRHRASFLIGMSMRISQRLTDMAAEQQQARAASGSGTDLVVVGNALVKQRFAERHSKVKIHGGKVKPTSPSGILDGFAAGDKVALSRGLNEAAGAKLLEKTP